MQAEERTTLDHLSHGNSVGNFPAVPGGGNCNPCKRLLRRWGGVVRRDVIVVSLNYRSNKSRLIWHETAIPFSRAPLDCPSPDKPPWLNAFLRASYSGQLSNSTITPRSTSITNPHCMRVHLRTALALRQRLVLLHQACVCRGVPKL